MELYAGEHETDYAATEGSRALVEFSECGNILHATGYILDTVEGLGWQDFGHAGYIIYNETII